MGLYWDGPITGASIESIPDDMENWPLGGTVLVESLTKDYFHLTIQAYEGNY